jgi:diguanylate cyclase (GGDEF)-like protein
VRPAAAGRTLGRVLKLLRYSQLIALAVLLAVVAALSLLYRGLAFESMAESEAHANVALTRTFANALWPAHAAFVRSAGSLPRATLAGREEIAALGRELRRLSDGLPVVKVKIYDLRGLTVYSTAAHEIGEDGSARPGFRRAREGYVASSVSRLGERDIVESYVPVHVYEAAPVEAVLEVYTDITGPVARMQRAQWRILAAVLGAMALAYAVVGLILARYQRLLREQERERAAQEERIRHQAYHDALTGLPNRASFGEQLEAALRRAKRASRPLGLLFLDLDRFKAVNDSLGHPAGDRLLRAAAERIRRAVREADMLFRVGGDEFTVLLEEVRGPDEAAAVAARVLDALAEPLALQDGELAVTASIGIALFPHDDATGERLVQLADTAMYRGKELGRNRFAFYAGARASSARAPIQAGEEFRQATT